MFEFTYIIVTYNNIMSASPSYFLHMLLLFYKCCHVHILFPDIQCYINKLSTWFFQLRMMRSIDPAGSLLNTSLAAESFLVPESETVTNCVQSIRPKYWLNLGSMNQGTICNVKSFTKSSWLSNLQNKPLL